MHSKFDQFSFLAAMSNSEYFCLVKEGKKEMELESLSPPATLESANGCQEKPEEEEDKKLDQEIISVCESTSESILEKPASLLGGQYSEVTQYDDDGFRTPTSLDHKIPVITHCPPAPRKIRPQHYSSTRKRKLASPTIIHQNLQLLDPNEVESMFPPSLKQDIGIGCCKIKKARRGDDAALS